MQGSPEDLRLLRRCMWWYGLHLSNWTVLLPPLPLHRPTVAMVPGPAPSCQHQAWCNHRLTRQAGCFLGACLQALHRQPSQQHTHSQR